MNPGNFMYEQNGSSIAPVVSFAAMGFPSAVFFLVLKSDFAEGVPVVGEDFGVGDVDVGHG